MYGSLTNSNSSTNPHANVTFCNQKTTMLLVWHVHVWSVYHQFGNRQQTIILEKSIIYDSWGCCYCCWFVVVLVVVMVMTDDVELLICIIIYRLMLLVVGVRTSAHKWYFYIHTVSLPVKYVCMKITCNIP